jgi:preprotein translocase subunit SecG
LRGIIDKILKFNLFSLKREQMYTFLLVLFVILSILLAVVILIQPGKGDMGLGSIGSGTQVLFGGSGGRSFFEKITWIMTALFILGALGLALVKSKGKQSSSLTDFTAKTAPVKPQLPEPVKASQAEE